MKLKLGTIALGVAGAILATSPAAAVVKYAAYSGFIASGLDTTGVFGRANRDLAGLHYAVFFSYDRARATTIATDGLTYDSASGSGAGSPIIDVSVVVWGTTRSFSALTYGEAITSINALPEMGHVASDYVSVTNGLQKFDSVSFYPVRAFGAPASLNTNTFAIPFTGDGFVSLETYDAANNVYTDRAIFTVERTGFYEVYGGNGAVPEPASWALMIAGFGLVGGALRQRRETETA